MKLGQRRVAVSPLRIIASLALGLAACARSEPQTGGQPPPGFEFVANRFADAAHPSADAGPARAAGACDATPTEPVRISCDGKRIVVAQPLAFHPGRSIPPEPARGMLDRVVALLRRRSDILLVRVEGYSSRSPGTSVDAKRREIELTQGRADAVLLYLWRRGKISAERLEAVGYGYDRRFEKSGERYPIVLRILQRGEEVR